MKTDEKILTPHNVVFWFLGLTLSALGVSLCTKSALGLSMIGAVPYILHVWLRDTYTWFTQGTAEYVWEAILLVVMCLIIRRFRFRYLLSFGTAVAAGIAIDAWLLVLGGNGSYSVFAVRVIAFAAGTAITALGIAFFFRTKMPLQVYEMTVTQIADRYHLDQNKVKYGFDLSMLAIAIIFSRVLTHAWTGVGLGTILITLVNAPLIRLFGILIDKTVSKKL